LIDRRSRQRRSWLIDLGGKSGRASDRRRDHSQGPVAGRKFEIRRRKGRDPPGIARAEIERIVSRVNQPPRAGRFGKIKKIAGDCKIFLSACCCRVKLSANGSEESFFHQRSRRS
jgi:hypothetical protein